ncbi:MAG: hypothetical protein QT02_C0001G0031 [archaeon GW2011_AR9]|nr:MAG: hypothetical protein QT02_C0001G0031 [archaeon GW2011_AR9]MBS3120220.1 hypothetical protein [Candidatus Woesearchaeota archaeon]HIH12650.1 hypothetical protein [Candidatus Woesearchaeota archaeon]
MDTPFSLLEEALQEITGKESYYFGLAPADTRKGQFYLLCGTMGKLLVEEPYLLARFHTKTPFPRDDLPSFFSPQEKWKDNGKKGVIQYLNNWLTGQIDTGKVKGRESDQRPNPTTSYIHLWDGKNTPSIARDDSEEASLESLSSMPQFDVYTAPSEIFRKYIQKAEAQGFIDYSLVSPSVSYVLQPHFQSEFEMHYVHGSSAYLKERATEAIRIMDAIQPRVPFMEAFFEKANGKNPLWAVTTEIPE